MLLKGVRKTKKSIDKVNALRTQAIACKNRPFGHLSTFIFVRFTKLIYVNLDHKAKRQLKIRLQHVVSLLRVEIKLRFHPKFFVFNRTYFNYGLISLLQLLYTAIRVIVNSMLNTESSIWVKKNFGSNVFQLIIWKKMNSSQRNLGQFPLQLHLKSTNEQIHL